MSLLFHLYSVAASCRKFYNLQVDTVRNVDSWIAKALSTGLNRVVTITNELPITKTVIRHVLCHTAVFTNAIF